MLHGLFLNFYIYYIDSNRYLEVPEHIIFWNKMRNPPILTPPNNYKSTYYIKVGTKSIFIYF